MYDKDYLEYDEYGLKEVRCMRCNKPIKQRDVIERKLPDGRIYHVYAMKTLSNFRAVPYSLSNGTFTNILLDVDCAKVHVPSDAERAGMISQFKKGHEIEAIAAKRSQGEINATKNRYKNLTVTKKQKFKEEKNK
jgi:hypothetical protein